jgi:hypothetical protein
VALGEFRLVLAALIPQVALPPLQFRLELLLAGVQVGGPLPALRFEGRCFVATAGLFALPVAAAGLQVG